VCSTAPSYSGSQHFGFQPTHQLIKPGIWTVTSFSLVKMYHRFEGKCCFHLQCILLQLKYGRRLPLKHCCPSTNLQRVTSWSIGSPPIKPKLSHILGSSKFMVFRLIWMQEMVLSSYSFQLTVYNHVSVAYEIDMASLICYNQIKAHVIHHITYWYLIFVWPCIIN